MFNIRIKETRQLKGQTQEEFAKMLGISKTALFSYEKGDKNPDFSTLIKIANALDVNIDYLAGRNNDFRELSKSKSIKEVMLLNQPLPCNLKVTEHKSFTPESDHFIYGIGYGSSIEFVDPFRELDDSPYDRIYLRFANTTKAFTMHYQAFNLFTFQKKFGFLGRQPGIMGLIWDPCIFDVVKDNSKFFSSATYLDMDHARYSTEVEKQLKECGIIFMGNRLQELTGQQYDTGNIPGYYEIPLSSLSFAINLSKLLYDIIGGIDKSTITNHINPYLSDIIIKTAVIKSQIFDTFGYKSLLGLLYYELLYDIQNGTTLACCKKCGEFHISIAGSEGLCYKCN